MRQTIATVAVLAALAAATGQDTVKLPDADFWVVSLGPHIGYRYAHDAESWKTGQPTKEWIDAAGKTKVWKVYYLLPGDRSVRSLWLTRRVASIPTREEVRLAVRKGMLEMRRKPTRPPGPTWKLVGRYYRDKLRRRLPLPTIGRW